MNRILSIQDISCVGKVSLGVALPIISAMGIETGIIPAALLSTHTGFKNFTFLDLSDEIPKIASHLKSENIAFDGIYTGYLGGLKQIEIASKIFADFGENALKFVDPVMGDNGKFYSGFDENFAKAIKKYCQKADIITPNITEACFLCGVEYKNDYDSEYIQNLLSQLSSLGAKKVILKGISYDKKSCQIIAYDCISHAQESYTHELLDQSFHGTGDIFASVCFASLVLNKDLLSAIKLAADFVYDSIKATISHTPHNWYGVDFESQIPKLIEKLK